MSRFAKLEFGDEERAEEERRPEVVKDEAYYLALAGDRFAAGQFDTALQLYSRALEFDARLPDAWLGQVQALIQLHEPSEARVWADKGLEQFPANPDLLAAKGVSLARLGQLREALATSDEALEQPGQSAYRWRARGDVLLARDDRNADFCFSKALAAAPDSWLEPLLVGRTYLYHSRPASALKYIESAVDRKGSSPFVWETMGSCLEALGRTNQALRAYRSALDLDRNRSVAGKRVIALENQGWLATMMQRLMARLRSR